MNTRRSLCLGFLLLVAAAPPQAPGAINPAVTQENIEQTICKPGWARSIRPPIGYTTRLKILQLRAAGIVGHAADYEEDHQVPLSSGGDPTNPRNLWPQPWNEASIKDRLESQIHRAICNGTLTLKEGQSVFLRNPQ